MEGISKYIVFQMNHQTYGADVRQILSIEKVQEITEVPRTAGFIKGVINLRGDTTPIIDLKERFRLGKLEQTEATRILIVHIADIRVGLMVDSATDVIDVDAELIEQAPEIIGGIRDTFIKGVAKQEDGLLILLNLEAVLDLNETNELRKFTKEQQTGGQDSGNDIGNR
ncbi:chemotaxis protein CheW [Lentibacillus sediminis]|uniref:chemotaxis protein CheW n=1 Tax=Lentibacillus sediminis TaxID=1940529 RepID=UPI000C1C3847|nr:chemotaxis protein CheW [Lentibacillus sediminis]